MHELHVINNLWIYLSNSGALVLYRVLRMRLSARDSKYSPERALEIARRIQFHQITLHRRQSASGLSAMTPEQKELFAAISLPTPSANAL